MIFQLGKFKKCTIQKIRKLYDLKNSKNCQSEKFREFPIRKIPNIVNLENS